MKIAVLYNEPEKGSPDSLDVLEEVSLVTGTLRTLGHEYEKIVVPLHGGVRELLAGLHRSAPDAVFNLVEAIGADAAKHPLAAGLLETAGYLFTGGGPGALFSTTDKRVAKAVMAANGIPTPPWVSYPEGRPLRACNKGRRPAFPVIIKPACEDASIGITDKSVISDERLFRKALPSVYRRLGQKPLIIEQFIGGREFNVSVVGRRERPEVLPPAEMLFVNWPAAGKPRIVNYKAKWQPDAFEYKNTVRTFKPEGAPIEEIRNICLACWEAFGLSGYARVDLRLDEKNRPFVIDVNSNPCIAPSSGFISAARAAGYTKKDAVKMILDAALPLKTKGRKAKARREKEKKDGRISYRKSPVPEDRKSIKRLLSGTRAFYRHEMEVALELLDDRLEKGPESEYMFLFCEAGGRTAGYACYGPITMARGRFDLYWIAVEAGLQRKGIGSALLGKAEAEMARLGGKYVYAETSSRKKYAPTRQFYLKNGYSRAARVPEYYARGDDKLIFMKTIGKR